MLYQPAARSVMLRSIWKEVFRAPHVASAFLLLSGVASLMFAMKQIVRFAAQPFDDYMLLALAVLFDVVGFALLQWKVAVDEKFDEPEEVLVATESGATVWRKKKMRLAVGVTAGRVRLPAPRPSVIEVCSSLILGQKQATKPKHALGKDGKGEDGSGGSDGDVEEKAPDARQQLTQQPHMIRKVLETLRGSFMRIFVKDLFVKPWRQIVISVNQFTASPMAPSKKPGESPASLLDIPALRIMFVRTTLWLLLVLIFVFVAKNIALHEETKQRCLCILGFLVFVFFIVKVSKLRFFNLVVNGFIVVGVMCGLFFFSGVERREWIHLTVFLPSMATVLWQSVMTIWCGAQMAVLVMLPFAPYVAQKRGLQLIRCVGLCFLVVAIVAVEFYCDFHSCFVVSLFTGERHYCPLVEEQYRCSAFSEENGQIYVAIEHKNTLRVVLEDPRPFARVFEGRVKGKKVQGSEWEVAQLSMMNLEDKYLGEVNLSWPTDVNAAKGKNGRVLMKKHILVQSLRATVFLTNCSWEVPSQTDGGRSFPVTSAFYERLRRSELARKGWIIELIELDMTSLEKIDQVKEFAIREKLHGIIAPKKKLFAFPVIVSEVRIVGDGCLDGGEVHVLPAKLAKISRSFSSEKVRRTIIFLAEELGATADFARLLLPKSEKLLRAINHSDGSGIITFANDDAFNITSVLKRAKEKKYFTSWVSSSCCFHHGQEELKSDVDDFVDFHECKSRKEGTWCGVPQYFSPALSVARRCETCRRLQSLLRYARRTFIAANRRGESDSPFIQVIQLCAEAAEFEGIDEGLRSFLGELMRLNFFQHGEFLLAG